MTGNAVDACVAPGEAEAENSAMMTIFQAIMMKMDQQEAKMDEQAAHIHTLAAGYS